MKHSFSRVLLMHRSDGCISGAQVQMGRLRDGLLSQNIDARIICRDRSRPDSILVPFRPKIEQRIKRLTHWLGLNDIHLISSLQIKLIPQFLNCDILDIHCMHSDSFSYLLLPELSALKPIVFTLHDMWPMTGHCHASLECEKWQSGCGKCPHPEIHPPIQRDATSVEWRLKRWAYGKSNFSVVAPSKWIYNKAKLSILRDHSIYYVPHGIDTNIFYPLDKAYCRRILGIPSNLNVLLCGMESMFRPLKGMSYLVDAINMLTSKIRNNSILLFFGVSDPDIVSKLNIRVIDMGYLKTDYEKVLVYSSADTLVQPSLAESFGLVALESMACGTPVVAFDAGATSEIVRDGISGIISSRIDPLSLSKSIELILQNNQLRKNMQERARLLVTSEFSIMNQVNSYINIYSDTIKSHAADRS
jgi:glycosyltransferase involved in cell wall biosynthesis